MATNYTTLLGFALPTTGELSGTWGNVVNTSITELVEDAIAGTVTADVTSGDWTLTTTGSGSANEARSAILIPTGTPGVSRNIIAPGSSKAYIVDNQSNAAVVVKASATTGCTINAGRSALVAWDGSDFVLISDDLSAPPPIGNVTPNTGAFTTVTATTGNITTVNATTTNATTTNATTVDTTNLEVTNLKAKDGTAAGSIANSTGVVTIASSVLTTTDINGGTIDGVTVGGAAAGAGTFTNLTANTDLTINSTTTVDGVIDDDTMATASATKLATSESIKAYVDSQVSTVDTWAEVLANGNTSGGTNVVVSSGDVLTTNTINETTAGSGVTVDSVLLKDDSVNAASVEVTNIKANDGTAAATVANSTGVVSLSANPVLSGGTANGVAYLNGSKVLTSGSALTFDGTNLGIGTSSPVGKLDTLGASYIGSDSNNALFIDSASTLVTIGAAGRTSFSTSSLRFLTSDGIAALERLRIDSSGNLGLGVTPSAWGSGYKAFQIGSTGSLLGLTSSEYVKIGSNYYYDGSSNKYITTAAASAYYQSAGQHIWQIAPSGTAGNAITFTQAMTLDASGRLGIGTTSPAEIFHVYGSSDGRVLINNSNVGQTSSDGTVLITQSDGDFHLLNRENASIKISTSSTERLRIDSSGNVGIGTTSPTNKLSVAGNVNITGNTTLGDASTDTVTVNGYMGVGALVSTAAINVETSAMSGAGQRGVRGQVTFNSAATTSGYVFSSAPSTQAAAFTLPDVVGFYAFNPSKGAGSTITNAHGAYIADQTAGTNNYGITSLVSSGTNKWNIYASGTAANYFEGQTQIAGGGNGYLILGKVAAGAPAPDLSIVRGRDDLASGAGVGSITWKAGSASTSVAEIVSLANGTSENASDLKFSTAVSGTLGERLRLSTTEAVFNEPGNDYDFRVESDTNTHALFVQGSDSNVGIGTASPGSKLAVNGSITESTDGTNYYNVVTQQDIGTDPNQVPLNQYLGDLAYQDAENIAGDVGVGGDLQVDGVINNSVKIDTSGNVGIGTSSPSASAILDAQSTTKGVRMPNMTTAQKNAIASPAAGLMVFDTTLSKLCVYTGVAWETVTSI